VSAVVRDTWRESPVAIWHWCPDLSPQWSEVVRVDAGVESIPSPGQCALLACRPSMGEDTDGNLYVCWEQFDPGNVEPVTGLMRGDVWWSSSDDGTHWVGPFRLTGPSTASCRFPCMIDLGFPGDPWDTMVVLYEIDQVAGFTACLNPQGPWTENPIVAHKLVLPYAVEEPGTNPEHLGNRLAVNPNPCHGRAEVNYTLARAGHISLAVFDAAGRCVATLAAGEQAAGRHAVHWDATQESPGVYFSRLTTRLATVTAKLAVQR